jgi:hypothetical protein
MDLLLWGWAVVLFVAGVPVFLGLGAMFVTLWVMEGWRGASDEAISRFALLYAAFALSGLLTASGGLLWAVVRIAYPPGAKRAAPNPALQPTAAASAVSQGSKSL